MTVPTVETPDHHHDLCACGGWKRKKNKRCAECRGYGTGRNVMPIGYVRVWCPGHPMADSTGYALEHRYVLHEAGIPVPPGSHVHHRNENRADNRLENLEVKTPLEHVRGHAAERGYVDNQFGRYELRGPKSCETCGGEFMPWKASGRFCSRVCSNGRTRAVGEREAAT